MSKENGTKSFCLENIPYQNWLTGQQCIEKIKILSSELFKKILEELNEKLESNYQAYNPWMLPTIFDERFRPLIKFNSQPKVLNSYQYIKLIKLVLYEFQEDAKKNIEIKNLLGIKINELDIETDQDIIEKSSKYFEDALNIILLVCPWIKEIYNTLVHQVLFIKNNTRSTIKCMSTHFVKGLLIFQSPKVSCFNDLNNLSIEIAHEIGHQALMVFLTSDKLISSSYEEPVYSGTRKTYRPAIKSLHAAAALSYMNYYLDGILKNYKNIDNELNKKVFIQKVNLESQLKKNLNSLLNICKFTNFGSLIIKELAK